MGMQLLHTPTKLPHKYKGEKMKLPIKKKYFDEIKLKKKRYEYRDAHITFVCEETGETLRQEIEQSSVINRTQVPLTYRNAEGLTEDKIVKFWLK